MNNGRKKVFFTKTSDFVTKEHVAERALALEIIWHENEK
jgi:hypothetical protein